MTHTCRACAGRERDTRRPSSPGRVRVARSIARPHRRPARPRRPAEPDEGLWIERSPSIHMFFMRFAIDAVFVGADGRVTKVVPDLKPWRVVWWAPRRARLPRARSRRRGTQRHPARRRAAARRDGLDLPGHGEPVDRRALRPARRTDAQASSVAVVVTMSSTTITAAGIDVRPRRTANAARRFASRAARSSRCCFVVGRTRSRRSIDRHPSAAPHRSRDELGLVVAALPQPLVVDGHRNQRHGARDLQQDAQGRRRRFASGRARRLAPSYFRRASALRIGPSKAKAATASERSSPIAIAGSAATNRHAGSDAGRAARRHAEHSSAPADPQPAHAGGSIRSRIAASLPCWRPATYRRVRPAYGPDLPSDRPLGAGRGWCYRTGTRRSPAEASVREDEPEGPQHRAQRAAPRSDRAQAAPARPHHPRDGRGRRRAHRPRLARHRQRPGRRGHAPQQRRGPPLHRLGRHADRRARHRHRQARAPGRAHEGAAGKRSEAPQRRDRIGPDPRGHGHGRGR